jgi:hypothetical protein
MSVLDRLYRSACLLSSCENQKPLLLGPLDSSEPFLDAVMNPVRPKARWLHVQANLLQHQQAVSTSLIYPADQSIPRQISRIASSSLLAEALVAWHANICTDDHTAWRKGECNVYQGKAVRLQRVYRSATCLLTADDTLQVLCCADHTVVLQQQHAFCC